MARILYANMNAEQKAKAEAWAEAWNAKPEDCRMHPVLGIVTNREHVPHLTDEEYDILSKGSDEGYVDRYAEITEEVRAFYRSEMAKLKGDNLPKVRLK